jgi:hypothetical protein
LKNKAEKFQFYVAGALFRLGKEGPAGASFGGGVV